MRSSVKLYLKTLFFGHNRVYSRGKSSQHFFKCASVVLEHKCSAFENLGKFIFSELPFPSYLFQVNFSLVTFSKLRFIYLKFPLSFPFKFPLNFLLSRSRNSSKNNSHFYLIESGNLSGNYK